MNREIEARLKISAVDKTGRTFKTLADKMGDINRRASEFNRRQSMLTRSTAEMYAMVARYAAPAALAYAAKTALVDFAALERQMTRIGITAGASAKQTSTAFAAVQKIAKDLNYDSVGPAIEALDTLVASGKSLDEALAFLPSVLATAQASGAATADIANTGLKAADALKIEAKELQRAFDIMVTGGKAGQFELKDMAQYIPGLANSFATLGYQGEDGLKRLVAILQTIREDTGDASSAATQAQNIFGKMFSEETSNKFKKFGINLRAEMEAAAKAGEDAVSAFVRLSKEAVNGDLSKLPLLFSDQEFRLGMQSLITSPESLKKFLDLMNSAEVDGTVFRDLSRVMSDTQASIDRMSSSWERMKTSLGGAIAPTATEAMDAVSNNLDYHAAVNAGLEKNGVHGFWDRTKFGLTSSEDEKMRMAIAGGYNNPQDVGGYYRRQYEAGNIKASSGRQNQPIVLPEFPGGDRNLDAYNLPASGVPTPGVRPTRSAGRSGPHPIPRRPQAPPIASMGQVDPNSSFFRVPSQGELKDALKIDIGADELKTVGEEAGRNVADGGREGADAIRESAAFIRIAGYDVSTAIADAARQLAAAASSINRLGNVSRPGGTSGALVNANTGQTMPPSAGRPAGLGPR